MLDKRRTGGRGANWASEDIAVKSLGAATEKALSRVFPTTFTCEGGRTERKVSTDYFKPPAGPEKKKGGAVVQAT